jgi:hypothetical protein
MKGGIREAGVEKPGMKSVRVKPIFHSDVRCI